MNLFQQVENFEFENIKQFSEDNTEEFQRQLVSRNQKKQNIIHVACIAGIPSTIKFLINQIITVEGSCQEFLNEQDSETVTPIMYCIQACDDGMPDIIDLFVNYKADINIQTKNGDSALHMSSNIGQEDVVKTLLKQSSININISNKIGETPLMQAIQEGQFHIFNILLERSDLQINQKDSYGYTAVHQAAITKGNSPVYIKALQVKQADMNALDNHNNTPIQLATSIDFKKFYRAIETLAKIDVVLNNQNKENLELRDYIIVSEEDQQTEYYKILYQVFSQKNYDITAREIKQNIKEEPAQQQQQQQEQKQKTEEKKQQKSPNKEWEQKAEVLKQQKQELLLKIRKENSSIKQSQTILLSVIVPLLMIAFYLTFLKN